MHGSNPGRASAVPRPRVNGGVPPVTVVSTSPITRGLSRTKYLRSWTVDHRFALGAPTHGEHLERGGVRDAEPLADGP
jgi:hypothetical protein